MNRATKAAERRKRRLRLAQRVKSSAKAVRKQVIRADNVITMSIMAIFAVILVAYCAAAYASATFNRSDYRYLWIASLLVSLALCIAAVVRVWVLEVAEEDRSSS